MYNYKHDELKHDAKIAILDMLESGFDGYLCDLHNETFNTSYEYVYTSDAKDMLREYDVFEAMELIKTYEQDNFGEVNTDLSNPCAVANMVWYIIGEEALQELMEDSEECEELWNEEIGDEEREALIKVFREKMKE